MSKRLSVILAIVSIVITTNVATGDTLIENFDNGISSERWAIYHTDASGAPWTVTVPDNEGRLRISKSADNDVLTADKGLSVSIQSRFTLEGDFSVFVDFDLLSLPLSNRRGYNEVFITAYTENGAYNFSSLRFTTNQRQMAEAYSNIHSVIADTDDSTMNGKLGITRDTNTGWMSAWIDRGNGPVLLGSTYYPQLAGPVKVQMFCGQIPSPSSTRPSTAFDAAFDNFSVTADLITPEPATLSLLAVGGLGLLRRRHYTA